MIAALYVETDGVYFGLEHVDPWDAVRDARLYAGPYPVVAHPPCARWSRYWSGGPSVKVRKTLGADDRCFAAAVTSVRRWGGVLEHPEGSHAWRHFGIVSPPKGGGWIPADFDGGQTCCIEQGHYGHRSRKATWLYTVDCDLHELQWGKACGKIRLEDGYHSAAERRAAVKRGVTERLSHKERAATPLPFRDLLIQLAESVNVRRMAA